MKEEMIRLTVRLPKEIYEKIKKEAEKENRSLNSQIITKLK